MRKSARRIFCRFCGAAGVHRHGLDARRRARFKCPHCGRTFTGRTNTAKSGSRFSDAEWETAAGLFCMRGGVCGRDLARFFGVNEKTGQRLNRVFRTMAGTFQPGRLPGFSEWDEAVPIRFQWVVGGVSRTSGQCSLHCVESRNEDTLTPLVERHTDPEGTVFTDEWGGYCGLLNRMTVCHQQGFVSSAAPHVHTNAIEGVWGHLKPLGRHVYRGFPRPTLPAYLAEFMFRYNIRCYRTRLSVLSALLSRKSHTLLV